MPLYVPFLKAKLAEFTAVQELNAAHQMSLCPCFTVQQPKPSKATKKKPKSLDEKIRAIAARMAVAASQCKQVFVDANELANPELQILAIKSCSEALATKSVNVIPVVTLTSAPVITDMVSSLDTMYRCGVAFRLSGESLQHAFINPDLVTDRLKRLGIAAENCDLMIDLGDVSSAASTAVMAATAAVGTFSTLVNWRQRIFSSGSSPVDMSGFESNAFFTIDRPEEKIFRSASKLAAKELIYGDYAAVSPKMSDLEDARLVGKRIVAKLRYTIPDMWLGYKGVSISKSGFDQYSTICDQLRRHKEYCGPTFSWGDAQIDLAADHPNPKGGHSHWVAVAVSHHISFVMNQLSSSSEP